MITLLSYLHLAIIVPWSMGIRERAACAAISLECYEIIAAGILVKVAILDHARSDGHI